MSPSDPRPLSPNAPVPNDGSGAMFDGIAARYDLLNRIMSLGLDGRWRRALVGALQLPTLPPEGPILDVATGTGDVALALLRAQPSLQVTGLDPSTQMLARAAQKRARCALPKAQFTLVEGDAQAMPFADNTFAAACISFGIRNVPDRRQGLREMARVVRPGGTVAVLELGEPQDGLLRVFAQLHVHLLVPLVGRLLSGGGAYAYLQKSIERFPPPQVFVELMGEAGLHEPKAKRLSFGAVHLYTGTVV